MQRKRALPLDRKLYRIRYLIEVCFHDLKRFRAIGTRSDKTKTSFLALLHLACICLWLS
jgi:transposase